jgi:hypothetical protein
MAITAQSIEATLHDEVLAGTAMAGAPPPRLWRRSTKAIDAVVGAVVAYRRDEHMRSISNRL